MSTHPRGHGSPLRSGGPRLLTGPWSRRIAGALGALLLMLGPALPATSSASAHVRRSIRRSIHRSGRRAGAPAGQVGAALRALRPAAGTPAAVKAGRPGRRPVRSGAPTPVTSPAGPSLITVPGPDLWPLAEHQGGAYAAMAPDIGLFEQTGLTLDLTNHIPDPGDGVVHYIDPRAVNLEWQYFGKYHCNHITTPCPVSQADVQGFLTAFQAELTKQHDNPAVVGYYITDDYLGNISGVLAQLHAMIAADNATEADPRPTVCGFGGSLDYQDLTAPAGRYEKEYASLSHFANLELQNFSPAACDMVDLYIYSLSHRAPRSDYTMAWTLPAMQAALVQHGWSPETTPLIGSPQAWEGTPPTAAEIRQQTDAFCAAGAVDIIAFTWHNFATTGPAAEPELANSPDMRAGLTAGVQDCRRGW